MSRAGAEGRRQRLTLCASSSLHAFSALSILSSTCNPALCVVQVAAAAVEPLRELVGSLQMGDRRKSTWLNEQATEALMLLGEGPKSPPKTPRTPSTPHTQAAAHLLAPPGGPSGAEAAESRVVQGGTASQELHQQVSATLEARGHTTSEAPALRTPRSARTSEETALQALQQGASVQEQARPASPPLPVRAVSSKVSVEATPSGPSSQDSSLSKARPVSPPSSPHAMSSKPSTAGETGRVHTPTKGSEGKGPEAGRGAGGQGGRGGSNAADKARGSESPHKVPASTATLAAAAPSMASPSAGRRAKINLPPKAPKSGATAATAATSEADRFAIKGGATVAAAAAAASVADLFAARSKLKMRTCHAQHLYQNSHIKIATCARVPSNRCPSAKWCKFCALINVLGAYT